MVILTRIMTRYVQSTRLLSTAARVGFIGLGHMGGSMARNLLMAKHSVSVFDVSSSAMTDASKSGAKLAKSVKDLAKDSDVIFMMLRTPMQVIEVSNEVLEVAKPKTILIDCSTVDPTTSQTVCANAEPKGVEVLDAPVSGGVPGAVKGTLTFMVGGEVQTLDKVRFLFQSMGKNIQHCGGPGTGQVAKLTNNLILAICMIGVSEGMNLGIKLGIDGKVLSDIINTSTGRCWSSECYNPVPGIMDNVPSSMAYKGGFGCELMLKDLFLGLKSADKVGALTPLGNVARELYSTLCENGFKDKDFSIVYDHIQKAGK